MTNDKASYDGSAMEQLMTVDEVAEMWQVTPRYIRLLLQRKELPHIKLGKCVRIKRQDVEAYVNERIVTD